MSGLITRQDVIDVIRSTMNADVSERLGHDWRRVNAMVAEQGDAEAKVPGFDFLFLELYLSGRHHVDFEGEMMTGARWSGDYLPAQMSFLPHSLPFTMLAEGHGKIQQMYFDRSIFDECAASLFRGDPDNVAIRGFHGVFDPRLKTLADALLEEARRPEIGSDMNADLIAQQVALIILRHQNAGQMRTLADRNLSDQEMARVVSYLEEQIEDIGGMDTLAALVNMDVFSFTKAFKATTGESPGQFLIQRRLARVKELLRSTNDTLADITYATGFSNQPHMTSTFTKHFGVSPGKWRKAVKS